MNGTKRGGGFKPLGRVRLEEADIPPARARAIRLERAWRKTAGESLALRVAAVRVVRGVLELELKDPAWGAAARGLLPALLARICREWPELGIRRARFSAPGEAPRIVEPRAAPIDDGPSHPGPAR